MIVGIILGGGISLLAVRINKHYKEKIAQQEQEILNKAKQQAQSLIKETHSKTKEIKRLAREENDHMEEQLKMLKKTLEFKSGILEKRDQRNTNIKNALNKAKIEIRKKKASTDEIEGQIVDKLKSKTKLNSDTAKQEILNKIDLELELQKGKLLKRTEEETEEDSINIGKNILKGVIQRITSPSSVDKNTTAVKIKRDKFKGLLIGKGGKNIETFEELLPDISIIFNLEPDIVYVGGLNLVNRNIAKKAIEKLTKEKKAFDQRKIKTAIAAAKKEIDKEILKAGRKAIKTANIKMDIPEDLVKLVGRLKFRTSFGQNVLQHSIEMAAMAAIMASEINADVEKAQVAAFFHDIGKAIDHEIGGSHDQISKDILEEHNFDPEIVHAAYAHHDAEPQKTPEAMLVKAADAISAGRPGARQESLTSYLERIKKLEQVVKEFDGIKKAYAISAGREIRVIVDQDVIQDENIKEMASDAAHKIEEELSYPGKIKVNIIRRTQAVDYAK